MKRTKIRSLIALCSILVFASGCAKPLVKDVILNSDYPYYGTLEKAKEAADVIIEGKILSEKTAALDYAETLTDEQENDPQMNPGGETDSVRIPYTIYTVEIEQVYKGNVLAGESLEVKQVGGIADNIHYTEEDAADIEIGSTYIMFLVTYPDSPASLINPIEGIYEYKDDRIISNDKNKIILALSDLKNA